MIIMFQFFAQLLQTSSAGFGLVIHQEKNPKNHINNRLNKRI